MKLIFGLLIFAFKYCLLASSDAAKESERLIDGIVNITKLDYEHFDFAAANLNMTYCYVLLGHSLSAINNPPKPLLILVSEGVYQLVFNRHVNLATVDKNQKPNYEFITKCFNANPQYFCKFQSAQDMNDHIRCRLLFNDEKNPISFYEAYFCSPKYFESLLENSWKDYSWILYTNLLLHDSVDKRYSTLLLRLSTPNQKLDYLMSVKIEERWSQFVASLENNMYKGSECVKILTFLASNCRQVLIKYVRMVASSRLHQKLCTWENNRLCIVPRDFMKRPLGPVNIDCSPPTLTIENHESPSSGLFLVNVSLPKEIIYQIFLLSIKEDFVHALTVFRLVCKCWNEVCSLNCIAEVKEAVRVSPSLAKLFIGDVIVWLQREPGHLEFVVSPWPTIKVIDHKIYELVVETSQLHEDTFDLKMIVRQQMSFLDTDDVELSNTLLSRFISSTVSLYKEVIKNVEFVSYAQLDRFIMDVVKNFFTCNENLRKVCMVPFVVNEHHLWPNPETLLSPDFSETWEQFSKASPKDALKYLHRAFQDSSLTDAQRRAIMGRLSCNLRLIGKCALVKHRIYGKYEMETIKFIVENTCPDLVKFLDKTHDFDLELVDKNVDLKSIGKRRLYDLEYIIDRILADPSSIKKCSKIECQNYLIYVCCTTSKYNENDLRQFIHFCLFNGVDIDTVRDFVLLASVGAPIESFPFKY
jgi:hypothetical protein